MTTSFKYVWTLNCRIELSLSYDLNQQTTLMFWALMSSPGEFNFNSFNQTNRKIHIMYSIKYNAYITICCGVRIVVDIWKFLNKKFRDSLVGFQQKVQEHFWEWFRDFYGFFNLNLGRGINFVESATVVRCATVI